MIAEKDIIEIQFDIHIMKLPDMEHPHVMECKFNQYTDNILSNFYETIHDAELSANSIANSINCRPIVRRLITFFVKDQKLSFYDEEGSQITIMENVVNLDNELQAFIDGYAKALDCHAILEEK